MKIWVIGHHETVLGFGLAGVAGTAVETEAELHQALDDVLRTPEVGVVLVTKEVAGKAHRRMEELKLRGTLPLVVEIPSPDGVPAGEASLGEMVLRAIGIRL